MKKRVMNITVDDTTYEQVNHISELTGVSRSKIIGLFASMVDTYFTEEQIRLEIMSMRFEDGRVGRKVKGTDEV